MTERDLRERQPVGFETRLLPMLLEAVEENKVRPSPRSARRRSRIRRTGVAVLAAAAIVVTTTVMVGGRTTVEVRAADALADPEGVVADLREAGIEAEILIVPVPLGMAGTWWHLYFAPGVDVDEVVWAKLKAQVGVGAAQLPEEIRDNGRGVYHDEVIELPRNLPGPLALVAGRDRRPGEQEAPMDNELAPNGAFWCLHLEELPPERAGKVLEDLGYEVILVYETSETPGDESRIVDDAPPASGITSAWLRSPSVIYVPLAPEAEVEQLRRMSGTPTDRADIPSWAPEC